MTEPKEKKTLGERIRARLAKRYPQPKPETVVDADGVSWSKVEQSRPWRPKNPGEELIGEYVGKCTRPGSYGGTYGVVTVRTNYGARTVSGVVISNLFESAGCAPGTFVRVVFRGNEDSANDRTYRNFDLYLATEEPCAACPSDGRRRWEFSENGHTQVIDVPWLEQRSVPLSRQEELLAMSVGDELIWASFYAKRIS